MSERTTTYDQPGATDRQFPGLSPTVRGIVTDSIRSRDRSFAVACCTVAGEIAAASADENRRQSIDSTLADLGDAVACFEAYVSIRRALLTGDRFDRPVDRDAAILGSDYLHAAAYAGVAAAVESVERTLELYSVLAEASTTLATEFLAAASDEATPGSDDRYPPEAILAGTAATVGATAAGATDEVRAACDRYARSLRGAIAAATPSAEEPLETATLILTGEHTRDTIAGEVDWADDHSDAVASHLERARDAIATLEGELEGHVDAGTDRTPLARLERATRIPFQHVESGNE
ncbi:hypothetical protein [Halopiger goleimassiliensis]|uniref:hypothetical protein n=1 Tax=Halopiger goleimassiliensis TaxID=1293048 RepID=UPI000677E142|nr:hypothetical protein [Halopiger goleimassiliensis]